MVCVKHTANPWQKHKWNPCLPGSGSWVPSSTPTTLKHMPGSGEKPTTWYHLSLPLELLTHKGSLRPRESVCEGTWGAQ